MPSRVVVLTVALLAAGLTVSACSGGSNQSGGSAAVNGAALPSEGHTAATAGVRAQSVPGALAISALTGRDLVLRATLSVRVSDVSAAAKRAEQLVATARGFVASENVHTDPGTPAEDTATMSLRVPESSYDAILASLVRLGTRVSEQQSSEDVTDQVVDTSSRLSTAKTGIARVRALLDRADNLGQVIQLESELSKREADLESLEQRLANLHRQVALATVDVTFSKSAKVLGAHKHHRSGFVGGITGGWHAFGTALAALLTAVGAVLPFALALLAIAAVGTFVRRRLWPAATIGDDSRA